MILTYKDIFVPQEPGDLPSAGRLAFFIFTAQSPTIGLPYHFDFKPTDIPYLTENNRNSDYKQFIFSILAFYFCHAIKLILYHLYEVFIR